MSDILKIKGSVRLQVLDSNGQVLQDTGFSDNLVTNVGKAAIAGLIGNTGAVTAFSYLALGTSNTAANVTDTTLGAEIVDSGLARASATVSRATTSVTNDTLTLTYTWTASGTKTIQEIGVLNASSSGVLLARKIPTALSVISGNKVVATYNIQLT